MPTLCQLFSSIVVIQETVAVAYLIATPQLSFKTRNKHIQCLDHYFPLLVDQKKNGPSYKAPIPCPTLAIQFGPFSFIALHILNKLRFTNILASIISGADKLVPFMLLRYIHSP